MSLYAVWAFLLNYFRVYSDEAREELQLLKTTWLIDEFEQNLKSIEDYETSFNHLLTEAPELNEYLSHFASFLTGDYPTWKYNKKIVAKVSHFISSFLKILSLIQEESRPLNIHCS